MFQYQNIRLQIGGGIHARAASTAVAGVVRFVLMVGSGVVGGLGRKAIAVMARHVRGISGEVAVVIFRHLRRSISVVEGCKGGVATGGGPPA